MRISTRGSGRSGRRRVRGAVLVGALVAAAACGTESVTPPPFLPDPELFWALDLNHHAATLSTAEGWNTLALEATPRNYLGEPLDGVTDLRFDSRDLEHVTVTPDGLVRAVKALAPGSLVAVVATAKQGDLRLTDSVLIQVVDESSPPVLGSLSAEPLPPDSAKLAVSTQAMGLPIYDTLVPRLTDRGGAPLALLTSFRSSDTSVARIDAITGELVGRRPGDVTFYVSVTAFGETVADTVPYRIGWPIFGWVSVSGLYPMNGIKNRFLDEEIVVGAGAMVMWFAVNTDTSEALDITFDDPTHVAPVHSSPFPIEALNTLFADYGCYVGDCAAGGNMVMRPTTRDGFFYNYGAAARLFPVPGSYDYRNTVTGASGRIVVRGE